MTQVIFGKSNRFKPGDPIKVIAKAYKNIIPDNEKFYVLWISPDGFICVGKTSDQLFADYYFGESQIRLICK